MRRFLASVGLFTMCASGVLILFLYKQHGRNIPFFDHSANTQRQIVQPLDLHALKPEIQNAVQAAHDAALHHARSRLEAWHTETMQRVDNNFLDWYFGYWSQQGMKWRYVFNAGADWLKSFFTQVEENSAENKMMEEISREFENRVMPGPILQQNFEKIAHETVSSFIKALGSHLGAIPTKYNIPQAEWDEELSRITVMVAHTEGHTSQPISLKALSAGVFVGGAGVALPVVKVMAPVIKATIAQGMGVVGLKAAAMTVAKGTAAKGLVAGMAKVGTVKAAAIGGSVVTGPGAVMVIAGLMAWEALDHNKTVAENRPLLRTHINEHLQGYEEGLVADDGMIGSIIYSLTHQIKTKLAAR